nr:hypothetical protein Iba_chr09aCG6230 [Ipomoea batatas]GMD37115.1 hypothetical protein Iba_chr09eCG6310 [Ipomoea batatas]
MTLLDSGTAQLLKAADEEEEVEEAQSRSATRAAPNSPTHTNTNLVVLGFPAAALLPNLISSAARPRLSTDYLPATIILDVNVSTEHKFLQKFLLLVFPSIL